MQVIKARKIKRAIRNIQKEYDAHIIKHETHTTFSKQIVHSNQRNY